MGLHRLSALAKRSLPSFIWSPGRRLLTAFLTPVRFGLHSGHFKSSLQAAAVDRQGRPIPWYTYPAIDFLSAKDFANKSVMEFGAGQSTLWWASRAKKVMSAESDQKWLNYVQLKLPANARAFLLPDDLAGLKEEIAGETFDFIVIDGLNRHRARRPPSKCSIPPERFFSTIPRDVGATMGVRAIQFSICCAPPGFPGWISTAIRPA